MSSIVKLAGLDVVSFRLALPAQGVGILEAVLDLDHETPPPSGTVLLAFSVEESEEPITYQVTIINVLPGGDSGRETLGRWRIFAVQGLGGMRKIVDGLDYAEVSPLLIAQDILSAADGEQGNLDALLDVATFRRWIRAAGTAREQLGRLCAELSRLMGRTVNWRLARDGRVAVGPETWPAYAGVDVEQRWTEEPDASGFAELALDAPDLAPGQTVRRPAGTAGDPYQIAEVLYELGESGRFRARVRVLLASAPATSQDQFRTAVLAALGTPLALLVRHTATVASQDRDGALGLIFDGPAPPCLTVAGVPYWPGLPGFSIKVPLGARCLVDFAGGREDSPIVVAWEPNGPVTELAFDDGVAAIGRVGDAVHTAALLFSPGAGGASLQVVPRGTPGAMNIDGTVAEGRTELKA